MIRSRLLTSATVAAGVGLGAILIPMASAASGTTTAGDAEAPKPTVVLLHGAWADSSGWNGVVKRLQEDGYPVVAPANPLRGLARDSAYLADHLKTIKGPIVLVGHSYGGAVITNAAAGNPNVKALVYIAAFAPDKGESVAALSARFPGTRLTDDPSASLPTALNATPVTQADGSIGIDLSLKPDKFRDVFLSDRLSQERAAVLAATQRPINAQALGEPSETPAWETIPSWYLVARNDHAIPAAAERFMAERANAHTVETDGPHAVQLTDPGAVTQLIENASRASVH
ncbi:alpha/beta fold hydrolase [Streptomyces sp. NPDC059909]|uniref:alpha/beta fold hydrolase n=1 Tax=Streptomyces sp. NPDC059909 TaxID=3346998 RepID=UPI00364E44B3